MEITPHEIRSPSRLAFLAGRDFHERSRFARSTIPEEKCGLLVVDSEFDATVTFTRHRTKGLAPDR